MALTPVEIRHIRLHRALFGYQTGQTDELLAEVVNSFEDVWRDRADLADKLEQLEAELVRYREIEQLLRTTLISAERASQQMTDQTRKESEAVLSDARAEAREIVHEAISERERLNAEVARIRAQLSAVLHTLGGELSNEEPPPGESTLETPPAPPQRAAPSEPSDSVPPHTAALPAEPAVDSEWPVPELPPPPRFLPGPGDEPKAPAMAGTQTNGADRATASR
jgi:cell division initiation protein